MKIIAHRGFHDKYKPNSKEALLSALEKEYIDGIEFDIRLTKDKKIVIFHDPIILKLGIVKKMNYRKLLKYNFGTKENPSKILLLDNFLKNLKTDKIILIDIKEETNNITIVNKLIKIISKYDLNIYLCSFNYNIIKCLSNYNVGLLIGYTINKDKLYNHFNFNIVHFNYYDKVNKKKPTFIWGITSKNVLKIDNKKVFLITDFPHDVYLKVGEPFLK